MINMFKSAKPINAYNLYIALKLYLVIIVAARSESLGIIGISSESLNTEEFVRSIESLGYIVVGSFYSLRIKTKTGWTEFKVTDVIGSINNVGKILACKYCSPVLEGPIIHGEVNAGLWEEAVRIFYPDGKYEDIVIMIHDSFVNAKIPTKNVDGLHGEIFIHGRSFKLPLNTKDLEMITALGSEALEMLDKAILAYGLENIISSEALSKYAEKDEFGIEEFDFNSGFVMIKGNKESLIITIVDYVIKLVIDGNIDKAYNIYEKLSEDRKEEIVKILKNELTIYEKTGRRREYNNIVAFIQKLNAKL